MPDFCWGGVDWEPVDPVGRRPNSTRQRQEKQYTNIYGNSLLKCTEGGDKTSQYSYFVAILSNWVWDNWVYRLPSRAFWSESFCFCGMARAARVCSLLERPAMGMGQSTNKSGRSTSLGNGLRKSELTEFCGCVSFFWYRGVLFGVSRWPKSPFWFQPV